MRQTQYQDISRFRREYSLDEILGETTVRLCQILSDSLFPSIFYKKREPRFIRPAARRLWGIEAESRRLLIDSSSLIFCQIGRITVRRLNELPW